MLPRVKKLDRLAIKNCDYLILRKLADNEAVFGKGDELTVETVFGPKGAEVNAEWIRASALDGKEPIPELDEAIGVEELSILPGTEVWHKAYGRAMTVVIITRDYHSRQLEYTLLYVDDDKENYVYAWLYALIPMEQRLDIYPGDDGKTGSMFSDTRPERHSVSNVNDFMRLGA